MIITKAMSLNIRKKKRSKSIKKVVLTSRPVTGKPTMRPLQNEELTTKPSLTGNPTTRKSEKSDKLAKTVLPTHMPMMKPLTTRSPTRQNPTNGKINGNGKGTKK